MVELAGEITIAHGGGGGGHTTCTTFVAVYVTRL